MSFVIDATLDDAAVPLSLVFNKGSGGVVGLTVVVSVRDGATTDSYLDFNDLTFKTSSWTTKQASLADLGAGFYALSGGLNLKGISNFPIATRHLLAEYSATGSETGVALDIISVPEQMLDKLVDRTIDVTTVLAR